MANWDVIVAGAGNAGLCAAHAARERGARVLVLEKAGEAWSGGNSAFTAGAIRFAHAVTCEITFTFAGVRVDDDARVLDTGGRPLPGLFAAGEPVGGLFFHNYPGGSGLTAGAVYGRRAGSAAAG